MLDVHPPHEAAHTWKDFFIHIATIVIGLLIAIGLEQTVEWLHHKSEVRETRLLLKEERAQNVEAFHQQVAFVRDMRAFLQNDLRIFAFLQQHPGTPLEQLPGVPMWAGRESRSMQASWLSAMQSGVLALMPQAEVEESRQLYDRLSGSDEKTYALWDDINKAAAYRFVQPDPAKLSRAQVDAEIPLIQDCLRLQFLEEVALNNIAGRAADFTPGPASSELNALTGEISTRRAKEFPAAWAFTQRDLDSAAALDAADQPSIEFARLLADRGDEHTVEAYQEFHATYPAFKPQESMLNAMGYHLLTQRETSAAIKVFMLNQQLYSDDWNTYDSLGEAYADAGNKALAIESYQHALKLNPSATSSLAALNKLQH